MWADKASEIIRDVQHNPRRANARIKKVCHEALSDGRDNVKHKNYEAATSNFAYAYQARCICDKIQADFCGGSDAKHAHFLKQSRAFASECRAMIDGNTRMSSDVLRQIRKIRDHRCKKRAKC